MRYARALLLTAALMGVAGCQTDMEMRNLNRNGAYAASVWDTEGFSFESDTRMVILDFHEPPIGHVVDSDTYIAYISIPLHPKHGLEFDNPSFGVGWSDVGISVAGIFDPTPEKLPYGRRVKILPGDLFEDTGDITSGTGGVGSTVDPRYEAYAAMLRDTMYNLRIAGAPVAAETEPDPGEQTDDD